MGRGKAGDTIDRFDGVLVFPEMGYFPPDAKHLTNVGKLEEVIEFLAGPY